MVASRRKRTKYKKNKVIYFQNYYNVHKSFWNIICVFSQFYRVVYFL